MTIALVLISLLLGTLSLLLWVTQATLGVGITCYNILIAVLARMNQAEMNERLMIRLLNQEWDHRRHALRESEKTGSHP